MALHINGHTSFKSQYSIDYMNGVYLWIHFHAHGANLLVNSDSLRVYVVGCSSYCKSNIAKFRTRVSLHRLFFHIHLISIDLLYPEEHVQVLPLHIFAYSKTYPPITQERKKSHSP